MTSKQNILRKPDWIRTRIPAGANFRTISSQKDEAGLATVCEEARCPNQWECWKEGTATFMLMGEKCTRACRFCNVSTSAHPPELDKNEPQKLANTVQQLKLKYLVLTTVDRDDLPDFGAKHIFQCVQELKNSIPGVIIEILVPDFQENEECLKLIASSNAEVIGHNVECTESVTNKVRDPRAGYHQSLSVLRKIKEFNPVKITKSSIMLGFGEKKNDVLQTMKDIRKTGVEILTIGQYLQPGRHKIPVHEYITPEEFEWYKQQALSIGFDFVASGPLVRSSYKAAEHYLQFRLGNSN